MKKIEKSIDFGGRKLTLATGHVAQQATSAVMVSYGETVVLATVVASPLKDDLGYFPLFVEYQERLYAGGRIKGSRWVKREGRPSDDDILTARLIDRSIRPLFPKEYNKKEVQVIITVLSVDLENNPDVVAATAVSAALASSSIPWEGPVAIVRVGLKDDKFITNPVNSEIEVSDMEMIISATDKSIVMIETGAKQIKEGVVLKGIEHALKETEKLNKFISKFASEAGSKKEVLAKEKVNISLEKKVKEVAGKEITSIIEKLAKKEIGYSEYDEFKKVVKDNFSEEEQKQVDNIFESLIKKELRGTILKGKRPDGRKSAELRALSSQVEILPRTHGSAIFERGQTQVLSIATLGASSLGQIIESAEGEETKRYMHHYSMPPYSVGETGRVGSPSRREIGHGALAEKAIMPVFPSEDSFPYAVRVMSEVLSSNGSTSMASTCGSTLSLMDAGVPLTAPIAGIAMGLIIESKDKYTVLTDITGLEDGYGDMDFKVAGSKDGITALQLDVKALNLTPKILKDAFEQAKKARIEILKVMTSAIDKPREKVSSYAPKIKLMKISPEKIGEVIGPGGKVIKSIIAETGAQVDIEDDGTVSISGIDRDGVDRAIEKVEQLTKEVMADEIYEGEVKRIESFGAFVEILPGRDGLVHISDMTTNFVKDPNDVVKLGDKVKVRVKEIDNLGRINLSMVLDKSKERKDNNRPQGRRNYDRKPRNDNRKSSGPHFPTTRYLDSKKKRF